MPQEGKPHHQRSRHHIQECWIPSSCTGWSIGIPTLPAYPCSFSPSALGFESCISEGRVNGQCACANLGQTTPRFTGKSESIWVKCLIGHVDLTCSVSYLIDTLPGVHIILGWGQQWSFCISPTLVIISARLSSLSSLNLYVKSHATQNSTFLEK